MDHVAFEAPSRSESQDLTITPDTTPFVQTSSPLADTGTE